MIYHKDISLLTILFKIYFILVEFLIILYFLVFVYHFYLKDKKLKVQLKMQNP